MNLPDLVHHNPIRFSLTSCVTEDSIESTAIATPLDASPPPPPSNTFSIINIVNDDPLPNLRAYPAIASTYTTRRRRAQTSPRPVPASIIMNITNIPQEQPITVYDNGNNNNDEESITTTSTTHSKSSKFWPKIKRMMMPSSNSSANSMNTDRMKRLFESMNLSTNNNNEDIKKSDLSIHNKPQEQKSNNKRWLGRNRARVGPQR